MRGWKQGYMFGRARKPRLFWFYLWRRDLRHFFVSGSWYCQIQTTWFKSCSKKIPKKIVNNIFFYIFLHFSEQQFLHFQRDSAQRICPWVWYGKPQKKLVAGQLSRRGCGSDYSMRDWVKGWPVPQSKKYFFLLQGNLHKIFSILYLIYLEQFKYKLVWIGQSHRL